MTTRWRWSARAALVAFALASAGGPVGAAAAAGDEVAGRVEKVDHATRTFTISGEEVKVDSQTEVTKDGRKASASDIQEGDEVRATMTKDDEPVATRIEVRSSGGSGGTGR